MNYEKWLHHCWVEHYCVFYSVGEEDGARMVWLQRTKMFSSQVMGLYQINSWNNSHP